MKRNITSFVSALTLSLLALAPMANAVNCIHSASETPVCEGNHVYAIYGGSAISGEALEVFTDGQVKIRESGSIYWVHVSKVSPDVGFLHGLERNNCAHFKDNSGYSSNGIIKAVFANGLVEVHSGGYKYFRNHSAVGKKTNCIR